MPRPAWDRLLLTYVHNDASDMLLVPGSPPILRLAKQWRALQIPPLEPADVTEMTDELLPVMDGESDGYAYGHVWYSDVAYFRGLAFGYPQTKLLVLTREEPVGPPPQIGVRNPPAPGGRTLA